MPRNWVEQMYLDLQSSALTVKPPRLILSKNSSKLEYKYKVNYYFETMLLRS